MKHFYAAAVSFLILASDSLGNQLDNGDFEADATLGAGQSLVAPGGAKILVNNPADPGYSNAVLGVPNWTNSFEAAGWRDAGLSRINFDGSGDTQYAFINNWETRLSQVSGWNIGRGDTIQADISVGFNGPFKAGRFQLWAGAPDTGNPDVFPGSAVLLAELSAATPDWTNYVPDQSLSIGQWHPLQLSYTAPVSGPMIGQQLTVSFLTSSGSAGPTLWDSASLTATHSPSAVPGTANLWLAGMPDGSTASFDSAPFASPTLVTSTDVIPGAKYSFSTTGTVRNGPDPTPYAGPEGDIFAIIPHEFGVENGIATVTAPLNSLIGVFLDVSQPDGSSAPTGLDFSDPASRNYLTLSPELKQPFFIGDGLTDLSVAQQIIAPAGATRLFLGTQDGSGWSNNDGTFLVEITLDTIPTIFEWNNPLGGQFGDGGNWNTGTAPGPTSQIVFNIPGAYEVDFAGSDSNASLVARQGSVTFDLATNTHLVDIAILGDQAGDVAALTLVGGTAEYDVLHVGKNAGATGALTVDGATTQLAADSLRIGVAGTGQMTVSGGADVDILTNALFGVVVGEASGAQGILTVSGSGSTLTAAESELLIGGSDTGASTTEAALNVTDGGVVSCVQVFVGSPTAHGTATVSGEGSEVNVSFLLQVGWRGPGEMHVFDGGAVNVENQMVVGRTGSGHPGDGELTIDGGNVQINFGPVFHSAAGLLHIGNGPDDVGTVTVTGSQSQLAAEGAIAVGREGNGTLTILNGATVASGPNAHIDSFDPTLSGSVGRNDGAIGTVTMSGAGSTWTQTGAMAVGYHGQGTLLIESGARLESLNGHVAREVGSQGDVTVSGAGSEWAVGQNLTVGGNESSAGGIGILTLSLDGTVTVANTLRLWSAGTVDVSGGGRINIGTGSLPTSGTLRVGMGGTLIGSGNIVGNVLVDGGTVAPGASPGALHVNGDFQLGTGSVLALEIGGTTAGSQYDQLFATGDLTLDGSVQISFINGFSPTAGDQFHLFDVDGTFTPGMISFVNAPPGFNYNTSFSGGVFTVNVPLAGDYNSSGAVDAADYVVWRKTDSGNSQGYTDWQANFGEGIGAGGGSVGSSPSQTGVPEPATLLLLIFATAGWGLRRDRASEKVPSSR